MILPLNCSGSHSTSFINFWISSRMPNAVIPGNIFHSNSVGIPSIRFVSLKWLFSEYHLILLFHVAIGSSPIFPTQSTESEKTCVMALVIWEALLHNKLVDIHVTSLKLSFKCGAHKNTPNSRAHVEIIQVVRGASTVNLSYDRIDFFNVKYHCWRHIEMWPFPAFSFRIPWCSELLDATSFPAAFVQQVLLQLPFHNCSRIQRMPMFPDFHLSRQVSPLLYPLTRQGTHLSASLENSTLRRVSNFFSSCSPVSPQLRVSPDLMM